MAINMKINQKKVIYGYSRKSGSFIIKNYEANIIRAIFNMRANGFSLNSIVYNLKQSKLKTRKGKEFIPSTIYKILKNKRYLGDIETPPIISNELFEKVQSIN